MCRKYANKDGKSKGYGFDQKEREAMIVKYAQLVKHIAGRMAMRVPSTVMFDELISAGCVGLIDAVDKFDPEKDVDLKTYAGYRIKGAILDELRSMDWYSRSMRKKIQDIERAVMSVEFRERRPAEDCEVADELGVSLEDYFKLLSNINGIAPLSLDEFLKDDENDVSTKKSFKDRIRSEDDPLENVDKREMKRVVSDAIKNLTKKEQLVISLYYYDELTLKEIGHVLGVTESRVCQIHAMVLIKLKAKLKEYMGK
jgi:RNA polymerase sigma factor for flagellar operon FliA